MPEIVIGQSNRSIGQRDEIVCSSVSTCRFGPNGDLKASTSHENCLLDVQMNIELLSTFQQNFPEEFDGTLDCASMAVCCAFNKIGTRIILAFDVSFRVCYLRFDARGRLLRWSSGDLGFLDSWYRQDHLCWLVADLFHNVVEKSQIWSRRHPRTIPSVSGTHRPGVVERESRAFNPRSWKFNFIHAIPRIFWSVHWNIHR